MFDIQTESKEKIKIKKAQSVHNARVAVKYLKDIERNEKLDFNAWRIAAIKELESQLPNARTENKRKKILSRINKHKEALNGK